MDDVKPPKPTRPPMAAIKPPELPAPASYTIPQAIESDNIKPISELPKSNRKFKKSLLIVIISIIGLILGCLIGGLIWYQVQLSPIGSDINEKLKVVIIEGSSPATIGQQLEDQKVIRSKLAFQIYGRINGTENNLQAGTYRLSPAESVPTIVGHLTNGNVDTFSITFLPGNTLAQNRAVLISAGYSEEEVHAGLNATYESPLFADKPVDMDLEGYIYGETYNFGSGATVEQILAHTFEIYAGVIEENDLVAKFKAQGLNLFQGITLASIVQREAYGNGDEGQIAQVFYSRLAIDMALGSDVTYQYIADKLGVERDINIDSPYNTRRYTGLPPGPIAAPGLKALKAVADPAPGDYLYFLSGDDNITYFGRTNADHEANIRDHCKVKCLII